MKRATFFDGQDIEVDDLEFIETQRVFETEERFKEIGASFGILIGLALSNPDPFVIRIAAGVAYDDLGQDPRLITGDPDPDRAAPYDLPFTLLDVGKLVTVAYATKETTPVDNPETGATEQTRVESYPTFQLRVSVPTPAPGDALEVILGTIATVDGSGNATFDLTSTQYWGARLTPQQLQDIADAVVEVRGHERRDHVSGVERVGAGGDPGGITVDSGTTPDEAVITNTVLDDSLLIDGHRLADADQLTSTRLTFDNTGDGAFPQLWAIWTDENGNCGKTLAAQYPAQAVITGLQLVDIAPFGIPFPTPLIIEHYLLFGTHVIRLNGNAVDSFQAVGTSGTYLLRTDADPDVAVLVSATIGSMPITGTFGSPDVETITTFPEIFEAPDAGRTLLLADGPLFLGFLMWSGALLNLLGYGTWAASGTAYDKRNYGNLDDWQVSDAFKTRLSRLISETRAYGFTDVPTRDFSGLVFRANATGGGDYAYIDGLRVRAPRLSSLTLTDNTSLVVYLEANGDGTATWNFQAGSGVRGVALAAGKMPVWNITTLSGGITLITDVYTVLSEFDAKATFYDREESITDDWSFKRTLTLGANLLGTAANAILARLSLGSFVGSADNEAKTLVLTGDTGTKDVRIYIDRGFAISFVVNASWSNSTAKWTKDTSGTAASVFRLSTAGFQFAHKISSENTAWDDTYDSSSGWTHEIIKNATQILEVGYQILSGESLLNTLGASVARFAARRADNADSIRTLIFDLGPFTTNNQSVRIYRSNFDTECYEIVFNARWLSAGVDLWSHDSGSSATATMFSFTRKRLFVWRTTGAPSTWTDDSTGWDGAGSQWYFGNDDIKTTLFVNTLTQRSMVKAWAKFVVVDGIITYSDGFNVNGASVVSTTDIRITFAVAFASGSYAVFGTASQTSSCDTTTGSTALSVFDHDVALDTSSYIQVRAMDPTDQGFCKMSGGTPNYSGVISVMCLGVQ